MMTMSAIRVKMTFLLHHMDTYTHAHIHTYTHMCTHIHTHIHTHVHTHTLSMYDMGKLMFMVFENY